VGGRIATDDPQLRVAGGYDHNYIIDRGERDLARVARVVEPVTGRVLEVATTEPGVQFYTGNSLDGSQVGKGGVAYGRHAGFCLETQHFPDSPNRPEFPSTILRPGTLFRSRTVFRFGVDGGTA
jgi:aldose 1-epimerase